MRAPLSVVVMLGGPGEEREVSLRSGAAVAQALRSLGHEVNELDPADGTFTLPEGTDVVFLALHGTYGEDGRVQSQLESLGVPYTGCGVEASQIAFNKALTKMKCLEAGVATPRFEVIDSAGQRLPQGWPLPSVLKPVCQGSSVGLHFLRGEEDWREALAECLRHDERALLEQMVEGRECTVGILDGHALPLVEVRPRGGIYDYTAKYTSGASDYFCPAQFEPEVTRAIQQAGVAAFEAIGGRDYARVDVMVDHDGHPFVLEVNTLPGMTETSLLPKAAAAAGLGYPELCQRMVDLALRRTQKPGAGCAGPGTKTPAVH